MLEMEPLGGNWVTRHGISWHLGLGLLSLQNRWHFVRASWATESDFGTEKWVLCNKYVIVWNWLKNWVMGRCWKRFEVHGKNMEAKSNPSEIPDENGKQILETGRKKILVIKLQRTPLKCVLVFCGRWNLRVMKRNIQPRTFLSEVLKGWLGSFWLLMVKYKKTEMK